MAEPHRTDLRASPEQLYLRCDPSRFDFETTAEVAPIDGTVGQDRALHSLEFGLDIGADGYNLFVAGPTGTGRNSTLRATLRRMARGRPVSPDWCYVHNFRGGRQPSVMSLPAGRGRALAHDMEEFVEGCKREIPRHFESDVYTQRREELVRDLQQRRERMFEELEQQARGRGFTLNATPMGVATIPLKEEGQPMSREEFSQLPEEQRRDLQRRGDELQSGVSQAMQQARRLEKEAQARMQDLDKAVVRYAITPLLNELRQEYLDIPKALEYLEQVLDDVVEHQDMFRGGDQQEGQQLPFFVPQQRGEEFFTRYKVNVMVSNEGTQGAPVVFENNPTYYNLFGRVDYRSQMGAVSTDHTMIKAGALHRANGGYLVVQALDVLTMPLVWETLKRTVRARESRIENLGEQYSAIPVATLSPEPIPLDLKVVIVGGPWVYHLLYRVDEDFRKLFRVKADFSIDMQRSDDCIGLYAGFISSRIRDEGLRHFDRTAVARVVEHGSRLVERQDKLSTRFIDIADLLTEANFWAGKGGADLVHAEHVERAIEEQIYRSNLIEERVHEMIADGSVMIDTDADVAGQVNGVSVYDLGDYRFGRPTRITARVSLGRGQVTSIEREIQMSGRIHSKGFAIISGYLHGQYAQERPLALSASIGFEQVYDEIEGDSASAAELYALMSAISRRPIKQGIAVTGSVNQHGEVQAVGATNEKIEGFFAVCKAKGLTGEQGVIIPRQNAKHLMLHREVLDAVRDGRFHVWLVSNVDEGIEILTGMSAGQADRRGRYPRGTLHREVVDNLNRMSRRVAAAARRRTRRPRGAGGEDQDNQNES